jgi:hypothetical protein
LAELKVPTLQHFATYCGGSVEQIYKRLAKKSGGGSGVSYETLREKWLLDRLAWGVPYDDLCKACGNLKGERNQTANMGALQALERYLKEHTYTGAVPFEKRYFALAKGLLVPVNPPLVLLHETEPKVLWPSFWKTPGRLRGVPGAVFGTILDRVVFSLPDYRDLELEFLDLSAPNGKGARSLRVYRRSQFPILTDAELKVETDKFVEAYFRHLEEKQKRAASEKRESIVLPSETLPLFMDRGPSAA